MPENKLTSDYSPVADHFSRLQSTQAPQIGSNTLGQGVSNLIGGMTGDIPFQEVLANISKINMENAKIKAMNAEMSNELLKIKLSAALGMQQEKRAGELHGGKLEQQQLRTETAKFGLEQQKVEAGHREKLRPKEISEADFRLNALGRTQELETATQAGRIEKTQLQQEYDITNLKQASHLTDLTYQAQKAALEGNMAEAQTKQLEADLKMKVAKQFMAEGKPEKALGVLTGTHITPAEGFNNFVQTADPGTHTDLMTQNVPDPNDQPMQYQAWVANLGALREAYIGNVSPITAKAYTAYFRTIIEGGGEEGPSQEALSNFIEYMGREDVVPTLFNFDLEGKTNYKKAIKDKTAWEAIKDISQSHGVDAQKLLKTIENAWRGNLNLPGLRIKLPPGKTKKGLLKEKYTPYKYGE